MNEMTPVRHNGPTTVRRALEYHGDLTGYIIAAVTWLYDPANKVEALAIFEKHDGCYAVSSSEDELNYVHSFVASYALRINTALKDRAKALKVLPGFLHSKKDRQLGFSA